MWIVMLTVLGMLIATAPSEAQQLMNEQLSVGVNAKAGTYQLATRGGQAVFTSRVAAQVNHEWLRSTDYPSVQAMESVFSDELGAGREIAVTCTGREGKADLVYVVQLYDKNPYAAMKVMVRNRTGKEVTVQSIRGMELIGDGQINLGGAAVADRVLSDSYSEDRPDVHLYDLGKIEGGMHRAVGSQLIYNREAKQSLFFGALTADRWLSMIHLQAQGSGAQTKIASLTVDSTGTTEIQKDFDLKNAPAENQVELSLPIAAGTEMSSERLMLTAGPDYHAQLLAYGDAIRRLHQARVSTETPMGWWSWTAYYAAINEGETLANADWQAEHLKALGYKYFQVDEGYQYARGEFTTANATQFPNGMRVVGRRVTGDGLTFGIWTAPFEVTSRAWVYENHKEWLVHNAKGEPISLGNVWGQKTDTLYVLDTTHPGAQEYLRQTYKTLVREWGVRFIKLDFMDTTAIEGFYFRPNTTALEAERIGLQIIRDTVGEDVVLDKDGSPMLTPVGLVDTGRVSADTAHSFEGTKDAATGVAARFYMNRNFFVNDPDAFNTISESFGWDKPLPPTLEMPAAQASIALSAISGGMYEIGDDMVALGAQKERLALVENRDLLTMAKIGRASTPLDLMSYAAEDELPSIFFLREGPRQSILTVFNWTKRPRSHTLKLADFGLRAGHKFTATDVLNVNIPVNLAGGSLQIEDQGPESVKVIKIVDNSVTASPPSVKAEVAKEVKVGETMHFIAEADGEGVPALEYRWEFGDGTGANGAKVTHAYTRAHEFTVRLTVEGVDGLSAVEKFSVKASGELHAYPDLKDNRRYAEPK
jgi:alpha-galactosidase